MEIDERGRITPRFDGSTELELALGDARASLPVVVRGMDATTGYAFATDVMPILSRVGCNAGTCHGSKEGKNGFKLSLRGYDLLEDHRALTDDHAARRTNRAAPEQSLMLLKASGAVPHQGGVLFEPGSADYEIVRSWIAGGLELDLDAARVEHIEVHPRRPVISMPGMTQQFRITATLSDGSTRDVTRLAFFESSNTDAVALDGGGRAETRRRGEAAILVRYEGAYAAATMTVMGDRTGFVFQPLPVYNPIDSFVDQKLERLKTQLSPLCTDAEFVRRVFIDLTGLPPTTADVRTFLADPRPSREKRDALVDQLVGSEAFVEYRTNKWADLLQVNSKYLGSEGAAALRSWIRDQVSQNVPYDEFVHKIVAASGSNRENPAAAYYKIHREAGETMENTTHLFLAVRFNCNKCHDHPFERWTQDQYYNLAAFFARVDRQEDPESQGRKIGGTAVEGAKPLYEIVSELEEGEVTHLRTGQAATPTFPYQHELASEAAQPARRERLADWLTSPENTYFARSYVNRIWAYLMGVGIIEPIDDIRAGNPPSNPPLLDWLSEQFVASGFDTQQLIRTICKSRTYQLSIATNPWNVDDHVNFSHALPRRLPAEVLVDAVYTVTGTPSNFPGVPSGTRAAALPDVAIKLPGGFLDQLGRPPRESACECERNNNLMLGPIMSLVNGPTIADAVDNPDNALARLESEFESDHQLAEELYLRILNRPPSPSESQAAVAALSDLDHLAHEVNAAQQVVADRRSERVAEFPQWLAEHEPIRWQTLSRYEAASTGTAILVPQADGSIFAKGNGGKNSAHTIVAYSDAEYLTGLRLETLTDERLPNQGPGESGGDGNFVITEIRVSASPLHAPGEAAAVRLTNPQATYNQKDYPVQNAVDGKLDNSGWAIHPQVGQNQTATFEFSEPVHFEGGTRLVVVIDQRHDTGTHGLGRFRLSVTSAPPPIDVDRLPAEMLTILRVPPHLRTDEQRQQLLERFVQMDPRLQELENTAALVKDPRLLAVQDLSWALINSPAFLFNR